MHPINGPIAHEHGVNEEFGRNEFGCVSFGLSPLSLGKKKKNPDRWNLRNSHPNPMDT